MIVLTALSYLGVGFLTGMVALWLVFILLWLVLYMSEGYRKGG